MNWIIVVVCVVVLIIVLNQYEDRHAQQLEDAYERGFSEGKRQAHFDIIDY